MNFLGKFQARDTHFCDELVQYFLNSNAYGAGTIYSTDGETIVDPEVKDADSMTVDLSFNIAELSNYVRILRSCIEHYKTQFPKCDAYSAWGITEPAAILHYHPFSKGFIHHTERFSAKDPICKRHLVFMTYLNDVPVGGETEFFHQSERIAPKKGLTLIWPADWTYTHRGNALDRYEKFIISGWFSFID